MDVIPGMIIDYTLHSLDIYSLFVRILLTIIDTEYATSHDLNQCWPDSLIYAALGRDELIGQIYNI